MSVNWLVISAIIVLSITTLITLLLRFQQKKREHFLRSVNNSHTTDSLVPVKQDKQQSQTSRQLKDGGEQPQDLVKPELTITLQKLLASGRWEEADKETLRIMLEVANRERESWLDVASIQNFPQQDLRAIDRLWVHLLTVP